MGLVLLNLLALLAVAQGGVVNLNIQPRLEVHLLVNETQGPLDISQLTPKLEQVEDRATTSCGCGYSVSNPNPAAGRIVAGAEVSPRHKLPYQVLLKPCFADGCALCGGTLLNKRYVLTAMHCVKSGTVSATSVTVTIGEHDTRYTNEAIAVQTILASEVIERSDYNEASITNDIAILRLSRDVILNENVVPACLPTDTTKTYAGQSAIVSGWGTTSSGGSVSPVLKETTVLIVSSSDPTCTKYGSITNEKMCAYTAGTDSCQGDSGGPLVVKEDGRYTVVGVVSYGNGCATPGYAGVYARVTNYLSWINPIIADGFCGESTSSSSSTSTASTTTTTTAAPVTKAPSLGPLCDITCVNNGASLTGYYSLNGISSYCTAGKCSAVDGSDLCKSLNYPCGTTSNSGMSLTCSNPCNLKTSLSSLIQAYLSGQAERFIKVKIGYNSIPSVCDLASGYCCATDYPASNLCYRLGIYGR